MKSLWWLFSICLLFGCSALQTEELDSITPSPSLTMTTASTNTPTPTITVTPTTTKTPRPTETPFPFPTPENASYSITSPNGEWIVWSSYSDTQMILQGVNSNKTWYFPKEIENSDFVQPYVSPSHWSVDGKYVYIRVNLPVSGAEYHGGWLYRLELETGDVLAIENSDWIEHSITSDSKYVAYIHERTTPLKVTFQNLETLQKYSIKIPELSDFSGGSINWSPDNSKILFSAVKSYFALVLVNRIDMTFSIIIDNRSEVYGLEWISNNEVIFSDRGYYLLNTVTGEYVAYDPESSNDD
ncbi:MAG: hypothetical protein OEY93_02605 [Anaerolineae bacterium]|nr:hypothetical protein [Anaerolineae bacterium]